MTPTESAYFARGVIAGIIATRYTQPARIVCRNKCIWNSEETAKQEATRIETRAAEFQAVRLGFHRTV